MNKPHKNLDAWKKGMELARQIYRLTRAFPAAEQYGLTAQMRRCAISVPANIAEGAARQSKKEFVQFLYIAKGSLSELDTYIELTQQLEYGRDPEALSAISQLMEDEDRMLSGLVRRNKRRDVEVQSSNHSMNHTHE